MYNDDMSSILKKGEEIIKDYNKRLYKCKIISKTAELWQLEKENFVSVCVRKLHLAQFFVSDQS